MKVDEMSLFKKITLMDSFVKEELGREVPIELIDELPSIDSLFLYLILKELVRFNDNNDLIDTEKN